MLVKENGWATVWLQNYDNMLSRFHLIPQRAGQTDRRTKLLYQYRASVWGPVNVLTRDKNYAVILLVTPMFVIHTCTYIVVYAVHNTQ